jgi:hypothetical protein
MDAYLYKKRLVTEDLLSKHHCEKNNYPRSFSDVKERERVLSFLPYGTSRTYTRQVYKSTDESNRLSDSFDILTNEKEKKASENDYSFRGDLYTFIKKNDCQWCVSFFFFLSFPQMKHIIIHMLDDIFSKTSNTLS